MVGTLNGAITNTPGLGAANEALGSVFLRMGIYRRSLRDTHALPARCAQYYQFATILYQEPYLSHQFEKKRLNWMKKKLKSSQNHT